MSGHFEVITLDLSQVAERLHVRWTREGESTEVDVDSPSAGATEAVFKNAIRALSRRARSRQDHAGRLDAARRIGRLLGRRALGPVLAERSDPLSRPVAIQIRGADQDLAGLPWELLADPRDGRLLLEKGAEILRLTAGKASSRVLDEPIRVLLVTANPRGWPQLDHDAEWRLLADTLEPHLVSNHVILERLDDATPDALRAWARDFRPHVVQFATHGDPRIPGLVLVDHDGLALGVAADVLAELLAPADSLRLLLLMACGTGWTERGTAVAASLARTLGASTLGFSGEINDAAALRFLGAFLRRLLAGTGLVDALAAGRSEVRTLDPTDASFLLPVVFTARPDEALFAPVADGRPRARESILGRAPLVRSIRLAYAAGARVIGLHGTPGVGRRSVARAATQRIFGPLAVLHTLERDSPLKDALAVDLDHVPGLVQGDASLPGKLSLSPTGEELLRRLGACWRLVFVISRRPLRGTAILTRFAVTSLVGYELQHFLNAHPSLGSCAGIKELVARLGGHPGALLAVGAGRSLDDAANEVIDAAGARAVLFAMPAGLRRTVASLAVHRAEVTRGALLEHVRVVEAHLGLSIWGHTEE